MIVIAAGGEDRQMPVHAALCGLPVEKVVLDRMDFAALAKASDVQLRDWVDQLNCRFIPPRKVQP